MRDNLLLQGYIIHDIMHIVKCIILEKGEKFLVWLFFVMKERRKDMELLTTLLKVYRVTDNRSCFSKAVEMSIRKARPIHIKTPEERKRFERLQEKHRNAPLIAEAREDYRKYGKRIKQ